MQNKVEQVADIFLYDTEKLRSITSDNIIKHGLLYFKENRVTEMGFDEARLWSYVEGTSEEPYYVELCAREPDAVNHHELHVQCACTSSAETVCKHAVALLYQYADEADNQAIIDAQSSAIAERVKRGRTEVKVKHISGKPWFGEWQAASLASTTHRQQTYQVQIRSLKERINYCTCPDHATNLLGTCKHIEAVLHKIGKSNPAKKISRKDMVSFVYLAWDGPGTPQIRLQRIGHQKTLNALLDRYFNAAGEFTGRLPDDFFRLTDEIYGRDNLLIGPDVNLYVRRMMTQAAHDSRAEDIRRRITQSNGVLPNIRARLYPYQMEGVAFLAAKGRALLADDMGLGKTLQAISAAGWLKEHAAVSKILIVCPATLKQQWAREIEKFTDWEAQVIQGGPNVRHAQYHNDKVFIIVNYELVMRDLTVINDTVRPDLLILDEAQRIKNWRTKIASTIKLITSRYAFVLTGTPMENRLEDLYSLMQVVDPNVLGPLWRYMIDYHITDEQGKVLGYRNLSQLRQRIAPILLRRERSLVRDQLPDRTQVRLDVPMTEEQCELHDNAMRGASSLAKIAQKRPLTPSEQNRLMAALQTARMACDAAGLVDQKCVGSPKLDEMANLLQEVCLEQGRKVVIFSQWERMTAMAAEVLHKMKIGCVRLHGGVPTAKRGDLIDRFREDDSIRVFLSTDAGGTGLNLQAASVLIHLDVPWNPAVLEQRSARIHRLGQKEKVQIILMVAENSYEERVLELLRNKQNLFDNVISEEASEDVVGISKKTLASLIDELVEPQGDQDQKKLPAKVELDDSVGEVVVQSELNTHETEQDEAVSQCVIQIQQTFGPRLQRIMGSGGGLLVVMDRVEAGDEALAVSLSKIVPVALIDLCTLSGLQRLGQGSPIADAKVLFDVSDDTVEPVISPLIEASLRKLKSAEILIEQECTTEGMALLASSMLYMAAGKAGLAHSPASDQASVWLYSEAVPKGMVNHDQATGILRAMALSQAPAIPEPLLFDVLEDARRFVGSELQPTLN